MNTNNPLLPSRRSFLLTTAAAISTAAVHPIARAAEPAATTAKAKPPVIQPRSLHPYPTKVAWGTGTFSLSHRASLTVASDADAAFVALAKDTWRKFSLDAVELEIARDSSLKGGQFVLGKRAVQLPQLESNSTYALQVTESGIAAAAMSAESARHAWFTLLQLLQPTQSATGETTLSLPLVDIQDAPAIKFRGLHLCVFHETPPHMIEKAVRLAAFFKFTHVIIEFWGMLRLETMRELSWPEAWSKAEAGKLISAAHSMGLQVIPMFNCWGHATACRIKHGRHVVLDQNPKLAPLFEPDGWTWCLTNPRSQTIIRSVCDELMEFCGPSEYFHIGCDEAYSHATCDRCRQTDRVKLFADHVNSLAAHIEKRGRRAIMWGDALLEASKWPGGFAANGSPALPTHLALDQISKKIVIADWHYGVTKGPVPTLSHFKEYGFDTMACPWNSKGNIFTLAKGAIANNSGFLMTTWHHLAESIPTLAYVANCAWAQDQSVFGMRQMDWSLMRAITASHLRKLVPAQGKFDRAGWNTFELPAETD